MPATDKGGGIIVATPLETDRLKKVHGYARTAVQKYMLFECGVSKNEEQYHARR